MQNSCKKIVFYIASPVHLRNFLGYFDILKSDFEVAVILDESYHSFENNIQFYHENNIKLINLNVLLKKLDPAEKFLKAALYFLIGKISWKLKEYFLLKNNLKSLFQNENVDLFVSFEDNHGKVLNLIDFFKKTRVKTLVLNYTLSNKEELGFSHTKDSKYIISGVKNRLLFSLLKNWKEKYKNIEFTIDSFTNIAWRFLLNLNPEVPWIPIGGKSDFTILESEFVLNYYKRNGYTGRKTIILAQPIFNRFFLLRDVKKTLNIAQRKIVLCALPPDFYPCKDFKNYEHLIVTWIDILAKPDVLVYISLHPRTKYESVKFIERDGVSIKRQRIEELIPLCDLFVASISATIRFALTNKKIILNYDVFEMKYTEYEGVDPVITVDDRIAFKREYDSILNDFYKIKIDTYYAKCGDYFGKMDGFADTEITRTFKQICKK